MPTNYGDAALELTAQWNRNNYDPTRLIMTTVGHDNGTADAYRTKEPEARHQFQWINIRDTMDWDLKRSQGYEFITKDEWTIHQHLWRWSPEGYCESIAGRLAARPAHLYEAAKALREAQFATTDRAVSEVEEELVGVAGSSGMRVAGEDGRPLQRTLRRR